MSNNKYTDKQLESKFGKRFDNGTPLFMPQELGYRCPKGHANLQFSEFKDHIWCYDCKKDYHYADDCLLIKDKYNPKDLPQKPLMIIGVKNWHESGNHCIDIPEYIIKKCKREMKIGYKMSKKKKKCK